MEYGIYVKTFSYILTIHRVGKAMLEHAFNWWFAWKRDHPSASRWDFLKVLLKEFQPDFDPDLLVWV